MSNNITISDVAEALGVSKTTVSRAISGKDVYKRQNWIKGAKIKVTIHNPIF